MGAVLHTLNVRYSDEQLLFTLRQVEDRVVIVDGSLADKFARILPHASSVEEIIVVGDETDAAPLREIMADRPGSVHLYNQFLEGRPTAFDWPELPESSAALMCFTSGTTGDPKGVVYSHRSVYLASMQFCMGDYSGLDRDDTALIVVPMFHANSWNMPYAALMVGAGRSWPARSAQASRENHRRDASHDHSSRTYSPHRLVEAS